MQLEEQLNRLIDAVDGAMGAALLSSDGVIIHAIEPRRSTGIANGLSEFGLVAKQLTSLDDLSHLGEPLSFMFDSTERTVLIRSLGPNYFVALWVSAATDVLVAQFRLRVVCADLMAVI